MTTTAASSNFDWQSQIPTYTGPTKLGTDVSEEQMFSLSNVAGMPNQIGTMVRLGEVPPDAIADADSEESNERTTTTIIARYTLGRSLEAIDKNHLVFVYKGIEKAMKRKEEIRRTGPAYGKSLDYTYTTIVNIPTLNYMLAMATNKLDSYKDLLDYDNVHPFHRFSSGFGGRVFHRSWAFFGSPITLTNIDRNQHLPQNRRLMEIVNTMEQYVANIWGNVGSGDRLWLLVKGVKVNVKSHRYIINFEEPAGYFLQEHNSTVPLQIVAWSNGDLSPTSQELEYIDELGYKQCGMAIFVGTVRDDRKRTPANIAMMHMAMYNVVALNKLPQIWVDLNFHAGAVV